MWDLVTGLFVKNPAQFTVINGIAFPCICGAKANPVFLNPPISMQTICSQKTRVRPIISVAYGAHSSMNQEHRRLLPTTSRYVPPMALCFCIARLMSSVFIVHTCRLSGLREGLIWKEPRKASKRVKRKCLSLRIQVQSFATGIKFVEQLPVPVTSNY